MFASPLQFDYFTAGLVRMSSFVASDSAQRLVKSPLIRPIPIAVLQQSAVQFNARANLSVCAQTDRSDRTHSSVLPQQAQVNSINLQSIATQHIARIAN